jgi:hypothetical protein
MMMRRIVRSFDALMRKRKGVFEFSQEEDCWLRLSFDRARHDLPLPGGVVPRGSPVLELHLWNEHSPQFPATGPDLGYSRRAYRQFVKSLRDVANEMKRERRLAEVEAVGGVTVVIDLNDPLGTGGMFGRLGFTIYPYRSPLGRFGEFWENLYTWALMWTYNPGSLRHRSFFETRRSEFWMGADEFMERFEKR